MPRNVAKTLVWKHMTSNCDVTNSVHQIKMTTICHRMSSPHEKFQRTPLSEAHKCDKCVRVGYIFYYEASQIQNINRMSGEAMSIVSDLLTEMTRTENLCPLSAPHQQLLSTVRTASAFVVDYSVRVRAAPQSQSFTP